MPEACATCFQVHAVGQHGPGPAAGMGLFAVDPIEKGTTLGTLFWDQDGSLDPIFVKAMTDYRRKLAGQWV